MSTDSAPLPGSSWRRIADILHAFPGVQELRATAGGPVSAYVSIPYDVDPDKLDEKARELRQRWG